MPYKWDSKKVPADRGGKDTYTMTNEEIKKTLEKQLQLLSERSDGATGKDLVEMSVAMAEIAKLLLY